MKRILTTLALVLLSVSGARAEAQVLYAASSSNNVNGNLYTVNPANGVSTLVGPILIGASPTGVTGLAFHPATGVLFGATSNAPGGVSPHSLLRIDPATGAATLVGVMANPVGDIAFDANGVLYGWSANQAVTQGLFTIDLLTGTQTKVLPGDATFPAIGGNGITFSRGVLYLTEDGAAVIGSATGTLRTVDPATGLSTVGPTLTGAPRTGTAVKPATISALATDPNKVLFGVNSDNSGAAAALCSLVSIDPTTGAVTDHGALPDNTDAIAFSTPVVEVLYAASGSGGNPGTLYTVDPSTAAATPVGPTAINTTVPVFCATPPCPLGMTGLAFHPVTHVLYGATGNATTGGATNPHVLVTIDPVTGDATPVGDMVNPVGDISFSPTGTLFGWLAQGGGGLVTIDPATGAETPVLPGSPFLSAGGRGLGFAGSTLYLTANGANNQNQGGITGALRTVNTATGVSTPVATLTGAPLQGNTATINALAGNLSSSLFGVNSETSLSPTTSNLVSIDPATGVVTDHGALPGNTDALAFSAVADLTITKTHSGNFFQSQTGATYSITVSNAGSGASSGTVTVSDAVPAGLTATGIAGTGWTCTQPSGPCTRSDALPAGLSYAALTLTVDVANNAAALVTNTATVLGGGDANAANNTANDPTTIATGPDPAISKTHVGNFFQSQVGAAYTITVTNVGQTATSGTVTVTDTMPAGLTPTAITGTGWACTQPSGPCSRGDALGGGLSYPALTLTVNVASNAPPTVTNSATVSGGGDVNPANDTANDLTTVATGPDLVVVKTHAGNFTEGQSGATYSITAINAGQTPTNGQVSVVDLVPTGLVATGIAGTGWACTQPAGPCTRSDVLGGGQAYPALTLTVDVAQNAPAAVTNTATVSGGGDVNTGNNAANDPTTILTLPDLTITKTHVGSFSPGQVGATYTITVSNAGGQATSGLVTVTDTVPAGLTATGIAGTGWTCTQPSGSCTRSDVLAGGASYPALTLTVDVSTTPPATVTNTATVSGGGEVNAANNTATDLTTITGTLFFALTPCRVLDTRNPAGPLGGPALGPGEVRVFTVMGACGIPAGAVSVSVNVTVTNQQTSGFLQVYPGDGAAPPTAVLNFNPATTRGNNALVALSSDTLGTIKIGNGSAGSADVILDVNGYFAPPPLP